MGFGRPPLTGHVGYAAWSTLVDILFLPLDGWEVAEARVEPPLVVGVDPGEDRPAGFSSGGEPVAVHDFSFE